MMKGAIVAVGIAVGLAFAIPKVAGLTAATIAVKATGIHLPTKEEATRMNAELAEYRIKMKQDAADMLASWHMTPEDCDRDPNRNPCDYYRTILRAAQ